MERGVQRPLTLSREALASGALRRFVEAHSHIETRSPAELAASRRAALAGRDLSGGVWLFAYGSLIWNPLIDVAEKRLGTAYGYHRRFCIWSELGRGSPERPGLVLALDHGGACRGVLLRVAPERVESELDVVWQREMLTSVYCARWLRVRSAAGPVEALAFIVNRAHSRYAGRLSEECILDTIAAAEGPIGRCADYLIETVASLRALGICEPSLAALNDRLAARGGA
ncbi:MAG: gamma-glutamylcyclotransferase [Rhodospirillales bacterium]|nr:gamma-glutamylcyclotransferase [Rhodospirillales bacterium]